MSSLGRDVKRGARRGKARLSGLARKAAILSSATALFAAKGFNGTRTRDIAKAAGVSEALIFKHFPTKLALYQAILAEQSPVPPLLAELSQLAEARADEAVFLRIAETIIETVPESLMRLLLFSALEKQPFSELFFQKHVRTFYDFLAGYIRQRIRDGVFRKVDPLLAARGFMGMLIYHRLLSGLFQLPVPNRPSEVIATCVRIYLEGLDVRNEKAMATSLKHTFKKSAGSRRNRGRRPV